MTRFFTSRSGELPLDADLGYRLEVVAPHVNRLRTLSCSECIIDDFSHFSNRPAPLLETFHVLPYDNLHSNCLPLPALFNRNSLSLRELVVSSYNPFPNNRFQNLSSFNLHLPLNDIDFVFWTPLLRMLRDSSQLEELFLRFSAIPFHPPPVRDIPTPVTLHSLRKLHLRGISSSLTRRFLNFIDLVPNGVAMQFTNIVPEFDWMSPPTLPPELSLHAMTSLEIVYGPAHEIIIQGTNPGVRIRIARASDSDATYADTFSRLVGRMTPQLPLRELWIHIKGGDGYKLPPLSKFPHLEKLVVRVTMNGNPIYRLLQMLDIDRHVPCSLLSTLDLSGVPNVDHLVKVLRARSKAGCRLGKLRLGKNYGLTEGIVKLGLRDYVGELEFSNEDEEPCGMELPDVCTTELGGWWEPWTKHEVRFS